jgi:hypothetical protein
MPMRAAPDDRSEMISQTLFGEILEVEEVRKNWSLVRSLYDDYRGWVDTKQYYPLEDDEAAKLMDSHVFYSKEAVSKVYNISEKREQRIVFGSHFPGYSNGKLRFGKNEFIIKENPLTLKIVKSVDSVLEMARKFMDAPYLWGGKTPFGVDCSGFTQSVFKTCGIKLKRDASQQVHQGENIDFIGDILPGDLAFFDDKEGRIIHVGIIFPNNKIMHASGKIRLDILDHNGIFNEEKGDYTHKLRIVKRFL